MKTYGVTYERLVGGDYKDLGTPYKELSENERKILQGKIDIIHKAFINEIKKNRKIKESDIQKISTGEFFLGSEAKNLGLIDQFGNKEVAIEEAKRLANITSPKITEFQQKTSFLERLSKISANSFYYLGKGIGSEISFNSKENFEFNAL